MIKIGLNTNNDVMLLFNRPVRGLLPQINRQPININNDNTQYEDLKDCQNKYIKGQ